MSIVFGRIRIKNDENRQIPHSFDVNDVLVEFDIAVSQERGFAGAIFRVQDLQNYERFYVRGHQSAKPDATQYSPVFNAF